MTSKISINILLLAFFLSIFLITEDKAQVINGGVTLTSQSEVNAFTGTSITGPLYIGATDGSDITDLTPLSTLTSVGDLQVEYNPLLTSLDGLNNITSVNGLLEIYYNHALANLDGLSGITSLGGNLVVDNNSLITNLNGLSGITSVGGDIYIRFNSQLTDLGGLSAITSVVGNLEVYYNLALTNLDGLSGIVSVGGALDIYNSQALQNLDGLSNITSLGGFLYIYNNPNLANLNGLNGITSVGGTGLEVFNNSALANLNGLSHITSVDGFLEVSNNSAITNLDGLSGITSVGGNLYVQNNSSLSGFCGLFPLLNSGGLTGTYNVSGNASNPTEQNVIDGGACSPLPIVLATFTADRLGDKVDLQWQTATEVNNYGFEIQREVNTRNKNLDNWIKIGFVKGSGNSNSPISYSFLDKQPQAGEDEYRLKQIDNDGKYIFSKIVDVNIQAPKKFELFQNYPNPFNPSTRIDFEIPKSQNVELKVYDILGREITTLLNEYKKAGKYSVEFSAEGGSAYGGNGSKLSSGIYFYRIRTNGYVDSKEMMLMK